MNDENMKLIDAIRGVIKEEVRTAVKEEVRTAVKEEVRTIVKEEVSNAVEGLKEEQKSFREETNKRFDKLEKDVKRIHEGLAVVENEDRTLIRATHDGYREVYKDIKEIKPIVEKLDFDMGVVKGVVTHQGKSINRLKKVK